MSASSLRVLQECPRQFLLQYLRGLPRERVSSRMLLGTAVHAALESWYRALQAGSPPPELVELVETAAGTLQKEMSGPVPVEFGEDETADDLVHEAERVLEAFLAAPYRPAKVIGVEEGFGLEVRDQRGRLLFEELVVGFLDLVVEEEDCGVAIIDHKISSRLAVPKSTELETQLLLYAWVGDQLYGDRGPVRLKHHVLVRGKSGVRVELVDIPRSSHDTEEAFDAICSGLELVQVAVEHPRPEQLLGRHRSWRCGGCGYRERCGSPVGLLVA